MSNASMYFVKAHEASDTRVWVWVTKELALISAVETAAKALMALEDKARKYDGPQMREFITRLDRREWDKALHASHLLYDKINNRKIFPLIEVGPVVPHMVDAGKFATEVSRLRHKIVSSVND